jgi:hypothetical protein
MCEYFIGSCIHLYIWTRRDTSTIFHVTRTLTRIIIIFLENMFDNKLLIANRYYEQL